MALSRADLIQATLRAITTHHPMITSQDPTGLGWTAKKAYLVYDAGTVLGTANSSRSPYIKSVDGWAICANTKNEIGASNDLFNGPTLISTDLQAVRYTVAGRDAFEAVTSVEYLGLTWYVNHSQWNSMRYGGTTEVESAFPVIDGMGLDDETIALMTLEAAGVRIASQGDAYTRSVYAVPRLIPPED